MRAVQIAVLKNQLSAYLQLVRGGEEILVRDRQVPIAKIIPLPDGQSDLDEQSLVAAGQMTLPKKPLDLATFWAIGRGLRMQPGLKQALRRAMEAEREESNAGLLGHKRHPSSVRSRSSK